MNEEEQIKNVVFGVWLDGQVAFNKDYQNQI